MAPTGTLTLKGVYAVHSACSSVNTKLNLPAPLVVVTGSSLLCTPS